MSNDITNAELLRSLDKLDKRLDRLEGRLDRLEDRLANMESKIDVFKYWVFGIVISSFTGAFYVVVQFL